MNAPLIDTSPEHVESMDMTSPHAKLGFIAGIAMLCAPILTEEVA